MNPQDVISNFPLSFDQGVAIECGINAAIIFNHIIYWLKQNARNPKCLIDDKIWMYDSQKEMASFFEFLSEKEVRNAIKILFDHGLIIKRKLCENHFDQTTWYSLPDPIFQKVFSKRPKGRIVSDPPVSSDPPLQADLHIYAEDKEKTAAIEPQAAAAEKIFYRGMNNELHSLSKSEVFHHFVKSPYSASMINEAIQKLKEHKGGVAKPLKLIESILVRLLKEEEYEGSHDEKRRQKEAEEEEYRKRVEEHKKKPKGKITL